jgi:hypothetical protein
VAYGSQKQIGEQGELPDSRSSRSLTILGLGPEAKAFFECLAEIYEEERSNPASAISDETFEYWRAAATES